MPLKIDHLRPISETPLKWCFAGVSIAHHLMLAWISDSFVIFRGSGSILLGNPIFL